jgi:hypothetical protein
MVDDHVHRYRGEIHQHDLGHRLVAGQAHPDRRADDRLLGDRRRAAALLSILGRQALADPHDAAFLRIADILAEHEYFGVLGHGIMQRPIERLQDRDRLGGRLGFRFGFHHFAHAASP